MRTVQLGKTNNQVSKVIVGMMRISGKTDAEIRELYSVARDSGIDFFDHADLYGFDYPGAGIHNCEQRFAEALKLTSAEREEIVLQTKTGIVAEPFSYDSSYEHITEAVNESLRSLNTDYIDILLIHRPDALVEPEEVARAFTELEEQGKVRHFGVSNHTPRQIDLLKTAVTQELHVNQMQLSVTHAPMISQGITANMGDEPGAVTRDGGGILDYSRLHNITVQAWSPFQKRFFDGVFLGSDDYPELNQELEALADKYDVTPIAIATAWILRHPANMQVVLGTTTPSRVAAAAAGADIDLTRAEWYSLYKSAGNLVP